MRPDVRVAPVVAHTCLESLRIGRFVLEPLEEVLRPPREPRRPRFEDTRPSKAGPIGRYYRYDLPSPAPGRHTAVATVRRIDTGETVTREMHFTVPE